MFRPLPILAVLATFGALLGCAAIDPPNPLERSCQRTCRERATRCTPDDCERGCRFVLDRLVEREGDAVVLCVAGAKGPRATCDDATWASCAAKIGPHADGGPPAPPPSQDDW